MLLAEPLLVSAVAGTLLFVCLAFWLGLQQGRARQRTEDLIADIPRLAALQEECSTLRTELALAHQRHTQLQQSHTTAQQQQTEHQQQLQHTFENLANRIFEQKQQVFTAQSKLHLDTLLMPFRQQIDHFRQRVDEVHNQHLQGHTQLSGELQRMQQLHQQMSQDASNLTRALKGDKKLQGNWGEHTVELLLEQAGLRKGFEYEREKHFRDEDGQSRRPDFLVHLPEGKHIIIDSKVSLVDYANYVAADTEENQQRSLSAHVQALRHHVSNLASKNYPNLTGMQSPDFVFLFLGIEPAYIAALEHSPSLFQEAHEKRIAIVTASTLVPVLRVVANLWSLQRQNQYTRELADQATGIYDKLRIVVEKMEKLGYQLDSARKTYDDAFGSLKDGRGNLLTRAEKFIELGVKVKQRLPNHLTHPDENNEAPIS